MALFAFDVYTTTARNFSVDWTPSLNAGDEIASVAYDIDTPIAQGADSVAGDGLSSTVFFSFASCREGRNYFARLTATANSGEKHYAELQFVINPQTRS